MKKQNNVSPIESSGFINQHQTKLQQKKKIRLKCETEATNKLFHINEKYSIAQISKTIRDLLEQAFNINGDYQKSLTVAEEIHSIISET